MRLPRHVAERSSERAEPAVPVVLPQVTVTVDEAGSAHVVVDGIAHPHGPASREELGRVLAEIADEHGRPVRVEVREPDGSRYADILQPCPAEPRADAGQREEAPVEAPRLRGEGFTPGETVLVAVIVTSISADPDGMASVTRRPRAPWRAGEMVLVGLVSGTTVRGDLPGGAFPWWRR